MMLARQMSAMLMSSPWQYLPVPGSVARRSSNAARPVANQLICQERHMASSNRPAPSRYRLMRGVISGCVSAASIDASERTRARAKKIARQQGRFGKAFVKEFKDCKRLGERHGVFTLRLVDKCRNRSHRIDLQKPGIALFALVDVDIGFGCSDALQIQCDPHAIGRRRTPVREDLEAVFWVHFFLSVFEGLGQMFPVPGGFCQVRPVFDDMGDEAVGHEEK